MSRPDELYFQSKRKRPSGVLNHFQTINLFDYFWELICNNHFQKKMLHTLSKTYDQRCEKRVEMKHFSLILSLRLYVHLLSMKTTPRTSFTAHSFSLLIDTTRHVLVEWSQFLQHSVQQAVNTNIHPTGTKRVIGFKTESG